MLGFQAVQIMSSSKSKTSGVWGMCRIYEKLAVPPAMRPGGGGGREIGEEEEGGGRRGRRLA